jgi:IS5 family transposase
MATEAVPVDTTVQEKAIAHPTEHGLLLTAIEQLGAHAKKAGSRLRQSYVRVTRRADENGALSKRAAKETSEAAVEIHARVRLRDVRRKMAATAVLSERRAQRFEIGLGKAWRISQQRHGDPGYPFSWHATEVECIRGKARAPYEVGCKVSLATTIPLFVRSNF